MSTRTQAQSNHVGTGVPEGGDATSRVALDVLGGFDLRINGTPVELAGQAQRLLGYLAIQERPAPRILVASALWPDKDEARSAANLRSALWRLRQLGHDVVRTTGDKLRLADRVSVDAHRVQAVAWKVIDGGAVDLTRAPDELLAGELLPGWYDDWVLTEQTRLQQLRMHALEELCHAFAALGHAAAAVEVGLLAVGLDPLRESTQRALVRAHLEEGNRSEAVRQYRRFEHHLQRELGIGPSEALHRLVFVPPERDPA